MANYDLIIIGGGPAGYVAAERAGEHGARVLLVEERNVGGVCLNEGCIPTKSLLHTAKLYHHARESAAFGVHVSDARYSLPEAMAHKDKVISTLQKGILAQFKRFGVEYRNARARLLGPGRVAVNEEEHRAGNVLIATGGSVARAPIPGIESPAVLTSTEILSIQEQPRSLVVIGGGYIGMEFASFFASIGTQVTVVEMMSEIIPMLPAATAAALRAQAGPITYKLAHRVERIEGGRLTISHQGSSGTVQETIEAEKILLAIGRVPNVNNQGFEAAGLDFDKRGVRVDQYLQTNLPRVYAAGDVTGKILLAHVAYRQAEVAVDHMLRDTTTPAAAGSRCAWSNRMRYSAVPWVVFTAPEVAGCGLNPDEARAAGHDAVHVTLPMQFSGRYAAEHPRERGSCTLVADRSTGRVLGVQMLGSGVGEIIHSVAFILEQELTVADVRATIFPHPTVSEIIREAAWALTDAPAAPPKADATEGGHAPNNRASDAPADRQTPHTTNQ